MANDMVNVGKVELLAISDLAIHPKPTDYFPSVPEADWEPYRHLLLPNGRMDVNIGVYLVRSSGKLVLVDTGFGPGPHYRGIPGQLMAGLEKADIEPSAIDIVTYTHLHGDHVGWNYIVPGAPVPTFANAEFVVLREEWASFKSRQDEDRLKAARMQLLPLEQQGRLRVVEDGFELTPEVRLLLTPGHSPGHTCIEIESGDERGIIIGDAFLHPAQVWEPDWSHPADSAPAQAAETRRRLRDKAADEAALIAACHFAHPGYGWIVQTDGAYEWRAME